MGFNLLDSAFRAAGSFLNGYSATNNNYYTTQGIGYTTPQWINTTNYWHLYNSIPELQAVINRKAKMIASGQPKLVDMDGNPYEGKHWMVDLIKRPTPLMSWDNVIYMTSINYSVTNNALLYAPMRTMGTRKLLVPIAFNNVKINPVNTGLEQVEIDGVIKGISIPIDNKGEFKEYSIEDLVYMFEPDGINLYDTKSKLEALKYPLSNLTRQYEKRNVLLRNVFALGILSADNGDGITSMALDGEDVKDIRNDIKKRNQDEIIITDKALKYQNMSFPTRDLMLFEEMTADKVAIIDAFGLNTNMFGHWDGKGGTFSNVEGGERQAYNSTIIPEAEQHYDEITLQLGLEKDGVKLVPDFSHVSVLQEDENKHQRSRQSQANTLSRMLEDGIINQEQYAAEMDVTFEAMDKKELDRQSLANAQINLRGTVGGLNGVISLNTAVASGAMDRDSAVRTLVTYYGYDDATANQMITSTVNPSLE